MITDKMLDEIIKGTHDWLPVLITPRMVHHDGKTVRVEKDYITIEMLCKLIKELRREYASKS